MSRLGAVLFYSLYGDFWVKRRSFWSVVYQKLAECKTQNISDRRDKRREALGNLTSASHYCFNVNRTSLDHLLLGRNADVDKNVEWSEYSAGPRSCQNTRFPNLHCRSPGLRRWKPRFLPGGLTSTCSHMLRRPPARRRAMQATSAHALKLCLFAVPIEDRTHARLH
jgi:hypothetical protein